MKKFLPVILSLLMLLGVRMPDNNIQIVDFKELSPRLFNHNDTTYIVNFWATWCIPCRKELPDFERINANYKDQPVKVLLVSLDFPEDMNTGLIPFIKKFNLQSEIIVLDDVNSNYWIPQIDPHWNGNIPATLIYNRNYREFFSQLITYDELDSILKTNIIKL